MLFNTIFLDCGLCYNFNMTVQQLESMLIQLPRNQRLRLAHFLLSSVVVTDEPTVEFEDTFNISDWLSLSEQSFDFWDNEADAYYDTL